jgi:hypothetical protein
MANVSSHSPVSFLQKLALIAAVALAVYASGKALIDRHYTNKAWFEAGPAFSEIKR